jgi:hypothetical protein
VNPPEADILNTETLIKCAEPEDRLFRMERQMEFILEQQASAEVRWARLEEQAAQNRPTLVALEESIRGLLAITQNSVARGS